ncbi:MAG: glycosyltransferase, partial [Alphaproteobacteria bacterium]
MIAVKDAKVRYHRSMLDVIIPALNAASTLAATVEALSESSFPIRLFVVDGGSGDGTIALAERLGARVVSAARGRGPQLAAGVAATGDGRGG